MHRQALRIRLALLISLAALAGGCGSTAAQRGDAKAVLATVRDFFQAMEQRDVELARRTLIPEAGFTSVRVRDGRRVVRHGSNAQFIERLADRTEDMREWLDGPTVMVEGDVAMVWSPYFFERGGALSHTGIDVFTLVRTGDGWKMAGGAYSVVPLAK